MNAAFEKLQTHFEKLSRLNDADRVDALNKIASYDLDLSSQLRALLEASGASNAINTGQGVRALSTAYSELKKGDIVGRYTINRLLGSGGMGVVYEASSTEEGLGRRVALKIIKPEKANLLVNRFDIERQILAKLEHANVARLIDSGAYEGQQYFAMEYVEGQDILSWASTRTLTERLDIFRQVGTAISAAHRMLVVHRDLKPGNVLVTDDDQVKLLDFGIAKPLADRLGDMSIESTATHERIFSIQNAAPEQLTGGTISVACDIYALGVLLYQLLSNKPPFSFENHSYAEIEKIILGQEPKAVSRGADPQLAWTNTLKGDLDAIVARCLRKDPNSRYSSVEALLDDLDNYAHGKPVVARQGTFTYVLSKFLRRNKWPVTAFAVFALMTMVGITLVLQQSAEAAREAERARTAISILVDAFEAADPEATRGESVTAREVLTRSRDAINQSGLKDPQTLAQLYSALARANLALQQFDEARELLDATIIAQPQIGNYSELGLDIAYNRGNLAYLTGDYEAATELTQDILDNGSPNPENRIEFQILLAKLMLSQSQYADAVPFLTELLNDDLANMTRDQQVNVRNALANALNFQGHPAEALVQSELSMDLLSGIENINHPKRLIAIGLSTRSHSLLENYDLSTELAKEGIELVTRVYGNDSLSQAYAKNRLATALFNGPKDYQGALDIILQIRPIFIEHLGENHGALAANHLNAAMNLSTGNIDHGQADREFRDSLIIAHKAWAPDNRNIQYFHTFYGMYLNKRSRFEEALVQFDAALEVVQKVPEYKEYDTYAFDEVGRAVAAFAVNPSAENQETLTLWLTDTAPYGGAFGKTIDEQVEIAVKIGANIPDIQSLRETSE